MSSVRWIWHDVRYAVRSLLRDRGSVTLAVLALSLGIGATTVMFSVVYSMLIDGFPFRDSYRVVHFYIQNAANQGRSAWYPAPEFDEYRAQNTVFTQLLGGASFEALYNVNTATYRVRGALVDPRAFNVLGLRPVLGRDMADADGALGAPPTFLMSYRLWNDRFNGDPHVIGMTLTINGTARTLIAIAPPRFLMHGADMFFPTTITATSTEALIGGSPTDPLDVWTYGRLAPGVSVTQAEAQLEVLARNEAQRYPKRYPKDFRIKVMSLADAYTATSLKETVYLLVGAVLMLLLIACSNVANLLLARATARETELALRASLGATRMRLIQQLLAESFVLAATGTAIGGVLAYGGLLWVRAAIPANALPSELAIQFSTQALLATVGVTMLTTLVCGIVPALRAARGDLRGRLMSTGKGVGLRAGHGRLRTVLVAVQVMLAIVLLVGAGLMMRTLLALQHVDPGLDTHNVLVGRFAFPQGRRQTLDDQNLFLKRVADGVRTLPGVVAVSPSVTTPLARGASSPISIPGTTPVDRSISALEFVGDGYFRVTGLPLVKGRVLSTADVDGARSVAVVNRRFVHDFLADSDPIGRTVSIASLDRNAPPDQRRAFEIVGIVGDARNAGLQEDIRPQVFLPHTVPNGFAGSIVIRTSTNPLALEQGLRQQTWAVDPGVAVMNVMSLDQVVERDAFAAPKFSLGLMSSFAAIGLILSAIGVFSVMAYTVSLQTHDIGIRMALGAQAIGVMRMILWRGLRPIAVGVVIGLGASYGLSRLMASQIYGITTTDPWTFAVVALVLTVVGAAACVIPARRATRVDPLIALRSE